MLVNLKVAIRQQAIDRRLGKTQIRPGLLEYVAAAAFKKTTVLKTHARVTGHRFKNLRLYLAHILSILYVADVHSVYLIRR
eukprot:COSAG06_NODE_2513_length_6737_cov_2.945014_2_plen_81_part_00